MRDLIFSPKFPTLCAKFATVGSFFQKSTPEAGLRSSVCQKFQPTSEV